MSERLKDPFHNRVVENAPLPYCKSLTHQQLFDGQYINEKLLQDFLQNEGKLSDTLVLQIFKKIKKILEMQPNMIKLNDPVTIVGDIHGQFYDLQNILHNHPRETDYHKYLFLGDYVDRGMFSIQVSLLIFALKINSPKRVFMLRGNHQSRQMTSHFNFRRQWGLQEYNQIIYEQFMEVFDMLPLAALVNKQFFCVHGGISTNLQNFDNIYRLERQKQIPEQGLFCDLVWADPIDNDEGQIEEGSVCFNETRCCSYYFGKQCVDKFIQQNHLKCVIRAHQAKQKGYQMHNWNGLNSLPPVITVFSAPNYCDFYNNKGAVIKIQKNQLTIAQINYSPHPFYLQGNISVWEWSIPFIADKVGEIFKSLLRIANQRIKFDPITVKFIDRSLLIEELLELQRKDLENKMIEMVTNKGKILSEELWKNQQARKYAFQQTGKDFNIQKQIDRQNQSRPQKSDSPLKLPKIHSQKSEKNKKKYIT